MCPADASPDPPPPAAAPLTADVAAPLAERARTLCHPAAPPGPPAVWTRLAAGQGSADDGLRAAQACHVAWLKGAAAVDSARGRLFADLALAAWHALAPAQRPGCGLGAPLVRALAELDDGAALARLATQIGQIATLGASVATLATPPAQALVAALLRHLRQRRDWPALSRLLADLRPAGGSVDVVHLIYRTRPCEGDNKDYAFSRRSMHEHWCAGRDDATRTLADARWRGRARRRHGVRVYDLLPAGSHHPA